MTTNDKRFPLHERCFGSCKDIQCMMIGVSNATQLEILRATRRTATFKQRFLSGEIFPTTPGANNETFLPRVFLASRGESKVFSPHTQVHLYSHSTAQQRFPNSVKISLLSSALCPSFQAPPSCQRALQEHHEAKRLNA